MAVQRVTSVISCIKSSSNLEEFIAGEPGILPGQIVTVAERVCVKNRSTSSRITAFVAVENVVAGKEYNDEYDIGEIVFCRRLRTGDCVYLRFGAASMQTVDPGDPVTTSKGPYPGNVIAGNWDNSIGIATCFCTCGPGEEQVPLLVQIKLL